MRNYNTYLKGMSKAQTEKLFFLSNPNINMKDYNTIIDFGCATADVLKCCAQTETRCIGIDHDNYMLMKAKENFPDGIYYNSLEQMLADGNKITNKTLIIFNSVLHEIGEYSGNLIKLLDGTGATIVIRDMNYADGNEGFSQEDLSKLVRHGYADRLADFIAKYGIDLGEQFLHYLLKYTYIDNWELELNEDYFSFDLAFFVNKLADGKPLYSYRYMLEYKRKQVLKHFDITIPDGMTSHIQLIFKVKNRETER